MKQTNGANTNRWRIRVRWAWLLALSLLLLTHRVALAANIVVDGQFDDWAGQPNVPDPVGDASFPRADVSAFYWGTNPGDETVYFMIERSPGTEDNKKVYYGLFIDATCNGSYTDPEDRYVWVEYKPDKSQGETKVKVYPGNNNNTLASYSGNWGEAAPPGSRTEFGIPFSVLGITANQTICMYLGSYRNEGDAKNRRPPDDRAPDSGNIQWAPVPALGYPLVITLVVGVVFVAWRRRAFAGWGRK